MRRLIRWFSVVNPVLRFLLLGGAGAQIILKNGVSVPAALLAADILLCGYEAVKLRPGGLGQKRAVFVGAVLLLCLGLLALSWQTGLLQLYYFFLMDDLFDFAQGKARGLLLSSHFAGLLLLLSSRIFLERGLPFSEAADDFLTAVAGYALLWFLVAAIHSYKEEMERLNVANRDLVEASFRERDFLLERERGEISQRLHDTLGHSLAALLMNVRYARAVFPKEPALAGQELDRIETLAEESMASLRESVGRVRRRGGDVDLSAEVGRIAEQFARTGVRIGFCCGPELSLAPTRVRDALYRNIREAVTNSVRHGGAERIDISIEDIDGMIILKVKDNGHGCARVEPSFGLEGIRKRTEELGGRAEFSGAPRKGFLVKIELPEGSEDDPRDDRGRSGDRPEQPEKDSVSR